MSVEQRALARKLCRAFWGDDLAAFYERHGDGRWSEALQAASRFSDLTRAEIVKWLQRERDHPGAYNSDQRLALMVAIRGIERGDYLSTRQALEQGSAE